MSPEQSQLEAVIAGLEAERPLLGDAVVDAAVAPLRAKLSALACTAVSPPAIDQTLRQATILFLDLVGSTRLSQRLDPEEIHLRLDGRLAHCTRVVEQHGGKVLQYAGDGLLAVFGADVAMEDDPERAVRAGLALVARTQSVESDRIPGESDLNVRVGLHTGSVLLGGGVDAESSVRGSAVNVAARMEQTAPAGVLRITHETYRHVRGVFDVVPQPPLLVKGIDEPIVSYFVQRAKPRAFRVATRGIEGIETRMVGRDEDLERLQAAFGDLHRTARLTVLTVVADAGVGKSRLLYEFENWAESRAEPFFVYRARAQPGTRNQPYGLLRDLLAWRLQINDDDAMDSAKAKFEAGLRPLFIDEGEDEAESRVHVLGHLIGLDFSHSRHVRGILHDGPQIRSRAFDAATRMLVRVVATRAMPILMVLDDLHWSDDGSLDFLEHLARAEPDLAMTIIALTRPMLFERRSDWHVLDHDRRIVLAPLSHDAGQRLVDELLKRLPDVPEALRALITDAAEGNPYYMEELVKMLIDEGVIQASVDAWRFVAGRLENLHVPSTLTGVLQARIDSLAPSEKLALQQASVIGPVFWDGALISIDRAAEAALPGLVARELVLRQEDAALDNVRTFAFKHHILHQVTYETVLKRMRRDCHAKVATWLAQLSGARANDYLGATAEHYREAGDITQACEYFARAAVHAQGRNAHAAALEYGAAALSLLDTDPSADPDDRLRWRLLDSRERTYELLGRRDAQLQDIVALQNLADVHDDDRERGEAAWRRCDLGYRTGDYGMTESAARDCIAFARRAGDARLELRGQQRLAGALTMSAPAEGKRMALAGLERARAIGMRDLESLFLSALSFNASVTDELDTPWNDLALAIDRELGNRRFEARGLNNVGEHLLVVGENELAEQYLDAGLRLTRIVGDLTATSYPLISQTVLALRKGDAVLALERATLAVETALASGSPSTEVPALLCRGHAELALARLESARATYALAHSVATSIESIKRLDAIAGLANTALARDDLATALEHADSIALHLATGGTLAGTELPRGILLTCHRVFERADDGRARRFLTAAHDSLQKKAAAIENPDRRRRFLTAIPEHREIVAAWVKATGSGDGAT